MSKNESWFDESGDELRDDEYPEADESDDDTADMAVCPLCGAEVYEDADYCPVCDNYITPDSGSLANRPLWWTLLGLAGVAATVATLIGFLQW